MGVEDDEARSREKFEGFQRNAAETRERNDRLVAATRGLGAGLSALAANGWMDRNDSVARSDERLPEVLLGGRAERARQVIAYETKVNLYSAGDQLQGFAILLRAERSLMGAVAVARGVFEACLWSAALVDPTISGEARLQRALNRRLARLAAAVRLDVDLPSGEDGEVTEEVGAEGDEDDDEHGVGRDPAADIEDILTFTRGQGWEVKKGRRSWQIGDPLSIDWLVENLERRSGIERYAWSAGSSMAHGEHAADTASWMELSHSIDVAPTSLIRAWSTGVWAGPRLFLDTLCAYTGQPHVYPQFAEFDRAFWDNSGEAAAE